MDIERRKRVAVFIRAEFTDCRFEGAARLCGDGVFTDERLRATAFGFRIAALEGFTPRTACSDTVARAFAVYLIVEDWTRRLVICCGEGHRLREDDLRKERRAGGYCAGDGVYKFPIRVVGDRSNERGPVGRGCRRCSGNRCHGRCLGFSDGAEVFVRDVDGVEWVFCLTATDDHAEEC